MASKKSPNFTELEKTVLIELVDSRKGIIDSKQNDDSVVSPPGDRNICTIYSTYDTRNSALLHKLPLNFLNFISGCKLNILFVQ